MRKIFLVICFMFISIQAQEQKASLVQTAPITKERVKTLKNFVGNVVFEQSTNIASQSFGAIVQLQFKLADRVKKDQILAKVDDTIIKAQIIAAKAVLDETLVNLEKAHKDLKRYTTLYEQKAISQTAFDDYYFLAKSLESKVATQKANLNTLEVEQAKKIIYAPFDGIVVAKHIELGDWAAQGTQVAQVINPKSAEVEVNLPQDVASILHVNQVIRVKIAQDVYEGFVQAIIPKGDMKTRTFPVRIAFKKPFTTIYEGMSAEVMVETMQEEDSFVVMRDAIIQKFGQNVIFINNNNTALMVPVQIIGYLKNKVAISAQGLQEGTPVVVKGNERIFPNMPLQDIGGKQ
ncbi:MAG: efflux RND transporter periplasmic adaptor subunit [Sulfurospirillum sp.]|nr:efflux RND transporter periplasmic adaptor subunit [Sulfurospirillum sp.]